VGQEKYKSQKDAGIIQEGKPPIMKKEDATRLQVKKDKREGKLTTGKKKRNKWGKGLGQPPHYQRRTRKKIRE